MKYLGNLYTAFLVLFHVIIFLFKHWNNRKYTVKFEYEDN